MNAARPSVLRPGDWVEFDGEEHQVVALTGMSVRLRSGDGIEQVVLLTHLLCSQPASADLLWVNSQTYLPIQASANKGGLPGADDSLVTTYRFLSDTPDNRKNLTTPIPAGFTQTTTPPASPNG